MTHDRFHAPPMLPYDMCRCQGSSADSICPDRQRCLRYLALDEAMCFMQVTDDLRDTEHDECAYFIGKKHDQLRM